MGFWLPFAVSFGVIALVMLLTRGAARAQPLEGGPVEEGRLIGGAPVYDGGSY